MRNRRGGIVKITIDGKRYEVRGNCTINLGQPKREALVGHDGMHGYKELPQAPSLSAELSDHPEVSLKDEILNMTSSTVQVEMANGKTYLFEQAFYTGDGSIESEDGKVQFELSAMSADEVLP